MSNPLEGLQFPVQEGSNKPSTTRTGKEIIAEALSLVDSDSSQQASKEKIGARHIQNILKRWCIRVSGRLIIRLLLPSKVYIRHIIALYFTVQVNPVYSRM